MTPGRVRFALARRARAAARSAVPLRRHRPLRHDPAERDPLASRQDPRHRRRCGPRSLKTLGNVVVGLRRRRSSSACIARRADPSLAALRETLDPLFAAYYAIPVYAFYPLFIVIFGLGDLPQVLIGFMLGLVAVIVNTLNGLDRVPRVLLKTARIHRLGPVATALQGHAALCGAVHLHRHQARGRVFVHRRDRRRVDHVAHRPRLRDRLTPTTISTTP